MADENIWTPTQRALNVFGSLVPSFRFWAARAGNLAHVGLLFLALPLAAGALLLASGDGTRHLAGLLLLAASAWLAVPVLAQAWTPALARDTASLLQLEPPAANTPDLGSFFTSWLRLSVPLLVAVALSFLLPSNTRVLALPALTLLAAWAASGFWIRCALAATGPAETVDERVARIEWPDRLPPVGMTFAATAVFEWLVNMALAPLSAGLSGILLAILASVGWLAILNAFWVAFAFRFAGLPPRSMASQAADEPVAGAGSAIRALPWRGILLGTALLLALIASQRLRLVAAWLEVTDPAVFRAARSWDHAQDDGPAQRLQRAQVAFACAGNTAKVQLLIRFGIGAEQRFAPALACAARQGRIDTAQLLLADGADVNGVRPMPPGSVGYLAETPLQEAAKGGQAAMVDVLLRHGADPNLQTATGTALHHAAHERHLAIVTQLLKAGARSDLQDPEPPIFAWARKAEIPRCAEQLDSAKAAGLPLDARDRGGRTLLHWAAHRGRLELIEALLARGLSPQDEDAQGALPVTHLLRALDINGASWTPQLARTLAALTPATMPLEAPVRALDYPAPRGTTLARYEAAAEWQSLPAGWKPTRAARLQWVREFLAGLSSRSSP